MALWGRLLKRPDSGSNYERGIKLFDGGAFEDAIEIFTKAIAESRPGDLSERLSRFYLGEAHAALAAENLESGVGDVIEHLKAALAIHPDYADLHFQLGRAFLGLGEPVSALSALDAAVGINPNYARAYAVRARVRYDAGDRTGGLRDADRALALEPLFSGETLRKAKLADESGDTIGALALLGELADTGDDQVSAHAKKALGLYRAGSFDDAIYEYRQALSLRPQYADLRNQLGAALFAIDRIPDAIDEFSRAIVINPSYVEARLNRGLAYRKMGRNVEADADLRTVLQLEPNNALAKAAIEE